MGKLLNMPQINHDEIRHRILEILYKFAQDNPESFGLSKEAFQQILKIPEKKVFFNISYLDEKGLVRASMGIGNWFYAKITAFGIDVVENKEKYREQFPFIQTTIQEIHGDVYGTVIQAVQSQVSFNQQVTTAFQQAHKIIDTRTDITISLKEEVKKHLNLLEEELKSKEPDLSKIQTLWKWLKSNANWIIPTLTQVVLEGLKIAFG